jgi:hypothetical protein
VQAPRGFESHPFRHFTEIDFAKSTTYGVLCFLSTSLTTETDREKIKIEILAEHLPYELEMRDEATAHLQSIEFSESSKEKRQCAVWFKRNAAIAAFWTHARNLIEFLTRTKSADLTISSASAKDLLKTSARGWTWMRS